MNLTEHKFNVNQYLYYQLYSICQYYVYTYVSCLVELSIKDLTSLQSLIGNTGTQESEFKVGVFPIQGLNLVLAVVENL